MFTGIIESLGQILDVKEEGANKHFEVSSEFASELKVDQSLSHNGVCLTITAVKEKSHWVTAVNETLIKSNLGDLLIGDNVNLERCLQMNGRLDGHFVQGHVDTTARVLNVEDQKGSWLFDFEIQGEGEVLVEKGSVCVNGVSLTCFNIRERKFSVAIIPYTYEHTNFKFLRKSSVVNLEFDIIGKYIQQLVKTT